MEAQKAAAAAPVPAAPQAAVATPAPAATPAPTGLAGLLGPTTLSGFVDVYYGYNSNQPDRPHHGFSQLRYQLRPVWTEHDRTGGRQGAGRHGQPRRLSRRSGLRTGDEHHQFDRARPVRHRIELRSIPQGRISGVSGARGQGPADQRRKVRDSGGRGSDRDQGQLELLARHCSLLWPFRTSILAPAPSMRSIRSLR